MVMILSALIAHMVILCPKLNTDTPAFANYQKNELGQK